MKLMRGDGPLLRIGHRGAAALAPANSIAAIEAALEAGVDLVELDVLGAPDRALVLGHSRRELGAEPATLDDAFELLAGHNPTTGLIADIKVAGRERELVEALRRHGLVERAVASTSRAGTLQTLRRLEPGLARSRTYPRGRLYPWQRITKRLTLPFRIERLLTEAEAWAMTLDHRLVSRGAVARCHALGAAVFAWTVNDRARLEQLDRLGVDGVITDDPRIFRSGYGATLQA